MSSSVVKTLGQVKWFNNKSGYGFITVKNGEQVNEDIFVHHSDLIVEQEQYRYLVAGEYVEFKLSELSSGDDGNDNHKFKAVGVTGPCAGQLMCEVRRNIRDEQTETSTRSTKPSLNSNDERTNKEWMVVRRKSSNSRP
tara:strand:+ start:77 stop:493 length:417 start_codon:yes stop_codon:yes gene_type:complete